MRSISLVAVCAVFLSGVAFAQGDKQQFDDTTQLKLDALTFLQQQRNTALDSLAACQADSTRKIDRLTKEVAALKKAAESKMDDDLQKTPVESK